MASETFGAGKPATGVVGGSVAAHAPASAGASGSGTTVSGNGAAVPSVTSSHVPAWSVPTQSAAAGKSDS